MLSTIPFAACSSSSSNPGDEGRADAGSDTGCASLAGDWTIVTCGISADCKIIQALCSVSIGCMYPLGITGTADGTVSGNQLLFVTDAGTCTGEFLSTLASGTCQGYDAGEGGSCEFSATKK